MKYPHHQALKLKIQRHVCLHNILYVLFRKVQVVTVKNLFMIIYTFFTLYFFYFCTLCQVSFGTLLCFHSSSTTCLIAFLLWFISFSNSMSISCNCFLFRHSVCFCRERAFLMLFTRVELTGV